MLIRGELGKMGVLILVHSIVTIHSVLIELSDDDNSIALIYQNISDLPQPNRDTLAFLMIHLQR